MNINFEKVPVDIFDWIEKFTFKALDHSQKKEVLAYFSEEEYEELHAVSLAVKSVSGLENLTRQSSKKAGLLEHFDKHHVSKKEMKLFSGPTLAWQAAALVLMLLSGWLFYRVFDLKKEFVQQQVASVDTVYVTKEISSEPTTIHDTIYLFKRSKGHTVNESSSAKQEYEAEEIETFREMETVSAPELESTKTKPKGSSMKDDSLLRKFGFVAM